MKYCWAWNRHSSLVMKKWTFLNAFSRIGMALNHHHLGLPIPGHPNILFILNDLILIPIKQWLNDGFLFSPPKSKQGSCLLILKSMQVVAEKSWGIIFLDLLLIITVGLIQDCHLSLYESATNCIRAAFLPYFWLI